jgi:tetratricopeptide (TPR) repeat protein
LGVFTLLQGAGREGVHLLEESLALYRTLGDKIGQANTMEWLSISSNDLERAITFSRECLKLYRELGNLADITSSLSTLARLTIWRGDFSSPVQWLEEALSISHQLGNQTSEEETLITHGTLAYWQGDFQLACVYYEEAMMLSEKIGDHYQNLWTHVFIAYAIFRQGDIQRARAMFEDSIRATQKAGLMIALVFAVRGLASLNANQEQPERAARLFAWADAMRDQIGDHRPPVEQASVERDLAIIHSKVDAVEFTHLSAEGRTMTVEQAIALALEA